MRRYLPRSPARALAAPTLIAALALAAVAHGATVVDSRRGDVSPCPLPTAGEPPLSRGSEPVFCKERPHRGRRGSERPSRRRGAGVEESDDAFRALGGGSPLCARRPGGRAGRNCRASGALAHPYPIANYGLDIHINTGITRVKSNFMLAVQTLASFAWLGLLYLVKGVLLLLEWAFSLDLLGDALSDVRRALLRLHRGVLGEPWLMFALAVAGLWGIWRGFVQRRTIETISGLAATAALMVAALVLIHNPAQTVGHASRLVNEASLGLLSGASTGTLQSGPSALGDAQAGLFDALVLRPWCALEFADVRFCLGRPPADLPDRVKAQARSAQSVSDLWLRYPAGGGERNDIYERWKGDGRPLQPKVRMQKEGQTGTRLALVLLMAAGLLGAICLLFWLGFKLLVQAVLALVLLLFAPAMLLAPAFGDAGRGAFIAWAKRLLAAIVSKAIYALLLALVLVAAGLLAEFRSLGFIGNWLLQVVFWWGLFLKRSEIVGFLSVSDATGRHASLWRRARTATFGAGVVAGATSRLGAPGRALARLAGARGDAHTAGTQAAAHETLSEHADTALRAELGAARGSLERDRELADELRHTDRFLAKYDKQAQLHKALGREPPSASQEERAMLARREALKTSRAPDERLRQARSIVGTADRNLALAGREFSDRDRERLIEQRRRDLEQGLPVDHERNLRFAGVDPDDFLGAGGEDRARLEEQVRRAIERDRRLLAALPEDGRERPSAADLERARIEVPPEQVRERVRRENAARQADRRARRRREHVYRRR